MRESNLAAPPLGGTMSTFLRLSIMRYDGVLGREICGFEDTNFIRSIVHPYWSTTNFAQRDS